MKKERNIVTAQNSYIKKLNLFLAVILSVSSLCSGCRYEKSAGVPELLEPVAINSSYRPVELGSIGDIEIIFGTVVPKQYCSFFLTSVKCSKIAVDIGDYVKKGDIVAYADVDNSKEELGALQDELKHENTIFELENAILEESKKQLKRTSPEISNSEVVNNISDENVDVNTQIAVYDENIRYGQLLHEYRVEKLQKEIDALQQVVEDGVLRANHDGYVTYVKNISHEPNAQPLENIVIISDTTDLYIELSETIDEYKYGEYENKYINISGEKINVEEISYSSKEMIQAKINRRYPNVRFAFPEGYDVDCMKSGDACPVYFVKSKVENIPIISKDSLYEENEEYYVYVYKNDNQREKRSITIGSSDKNYVQVTDGLECGELVYYESNKRIPSDYSTYDIELTDFEIRNHTNTYELSNELSYKYRCKQEGEITRIAVADGDSVKEGDLLYVIDIGEGRAALTEAQNNINREKKTYETAIKELKKELAKYKDVCNDYATSRASIIQLEIDRTNEEHSYSMKKLQAVYDGIEKNNDGTGNISVYAETSGVVRNIKFSEGERVIQGDEILSVGIATKNKLLVKMREDASTHKDNIADVGESIFIEDGDTTYEGKCVGWTVNSMNNEDKNYVYSDKENVYISFSTPSGYQYPAFYVEMEDVSFYENMPKDRKMTFSYISMQDVVVVPKKYVHTEGINTDGQCSYVWKVVGENVIKQYVLTDEKLSDELSIVILSGVKEVDSIVSE